MKLDFFTGDLVSLKNTLSEEFMGEVLSVNDELGRIVLKNVVALPQHKRIPGYKVFEKSEIVEIRKSRYEEKNGRSCKMRSKDKPKIDTPLSEMTENKKKSTKYKFITDFGFNYQSAISTIQKFSRIGLIILDTMKGRNKRASIISVSTPNGIFIFDLLIMGDKLFEQGLKEVLQSQEIEKIIHDSRLLSDCLKSKHAVHLENVRDPEAEDIMVVYQERQTIRRHRRSLEYLIKVYLGDTIEGLESTTEWDNRPLNQDLLQHLADITSYMIPLQEAIERKYMKRLIDASRVYCTHVRNFDLCESLLYQHEKTLRKEMIDIVSFKGDIRGNCRQKMPS